MNGHLAIKGDAFVSTWRNFTCQLRAMNLFPTKGMVIHQLRAILKFPLQEMLSATKGAAFASTNGIVRCKLRSMGLFPRREMVSAS